MTRYIATRLHKALELAPEEEFFQRCAKLPHYVIDPTLLDLLTRGDVTASISAMVEAEIAHLPFEELLIEMEVGTVATRTFVVLYEYQGHFRAEVAVIHSEGAAEVDPNPIDLQLGDEDILAFEYTKKTHETWMKAAALALAVSLLMLNIQGVEKEVIEPGKLNRNRLASGKPTIPNHTVMRIGHVYGSNGEKLSFGAGRTMAVHMRAGHARRQHYGSGNSLTKFVYIPPVLVNFKPGVEPVMPKRVVAA